ncbi:Hsp20/alpha crystallin family protein [Candidatus Bathyarchaeota archaeon]|nr:Hsp20/alpha crystallin family protein [Candidatus Bathyarchaeota archaeon]
MERRRPRRSIFDLFEEYIERFERIFEEEFEALMERAGWSPSTSTIEPLTEVTVTPSEVIITADMPCARPESISVRFLDDYTVEIYAKTYRSISFREFRVTHMRGEFSNFHVRVRIPVAVERRIKSLTCRRGLLELRIPRKEGYSITVE